LGDGRGSDPAEKHARSAGRRRFGAWWAETVFNQDAEEGRKGRLRGSVEGPQRGGGAKGPSAPFSSWRKKQKQKKKHKKNQKKKKKNKKKKNKKQNKNNKHKKKQKGRGAVSGPPREGRGPTRPVGSSAERAASLSAFWQGSGVKGQVLQGLPRKEGSDAEWGHIGGFSTDGLGGGGGGGSPAQRGPSAILPGGTFHTRGLPTPNGPNFSQGLRLWRNPLLDGPVHVFGAGHSGARWRNGPRGTG